MVKYIPITNFKKGDIVEALCGIKYKIVKIDISLISGKKRKYQKTAILQNLENNNFVECSYTDVNIFKKSTIRQSKQ